MPSLAPLALSAEGRWRHRTPLRPKRQRYELRETAMANSGFRDRLAEPVAAAGWSRPEP
jgi:hypothetical protein